MAVKILYAFSLILAIGLMVLCIPSRWDEPASNVSALGFSNKVEAAIRQIQELPGFYLQKLETKGLFSVCITDLESSLSFDDKVKQLASNVGGLGDFHLYVSTSRFSKANLEEFKDCRTLRGLYLCDGVNISTEVLRSFCESKKCELLSQTTWGVEIPILERRFPP